MTPTQQLALGLLILLLPRCTVALGRRGKSSSSRWQARQKQPGLTESPANSSSGIWDAGKPIPVDPVMDFDFTRDDDNPLEQVYDRPFNVTEEEEQDALEQAKAAEMKRLGHNETSSDKNNTHHAGDDHEKNEEDAEADGEAEAAEEAEAASEGEEGVGEGGEKCATRQDERASSWFGETALPGTPCVFGVDPRDEGAHCIFTDGAYGSFGWCYTTKRKTVWGSCNEHCPLFGHAKILGQKLLKAQKQMEYIRAQLLNESGINATNVTDAESEMEEVAAKKILAAAPAAAAAVAPAAPGKEAPAPAAPGKEAAAPGKEAPAAPAKEAGDPATAAYFLQARAKVLDWLKVHKPAKAPAKQR